MIRKSTGISIFFPCFNDRSTIGKIVKDAIFTIKKFTKKYEIIVVDDGSTDGSQKFLQKLSKGVRNLRVIFHKRNLGYGGALRTGFRTAKYELIFYTDGDGQYDVKDLPLLLSIITKDIDFINGIKMSRNDPIYRIVIGNIYSFFTRWLFWIPIFDIDCDFRLIRKSIIEKLDLKSNSGAICIELVKKAQRAGAKFRQISIPHLERSFGTSQFFRADRIAKTLSEVLILWLDLMLVFKISKLLKKLRLQLRATQDYNPIQADEKKSFKTY